MSKKKKKTRGNPANSPHRMESNTRIVDAYRASRSRRGLDPDDTWLVGAALDMKRDYLGSPDPRSWHEQDLQVLLTEVFPRKVLLEEVDREVLPAVMADFLKFMAETGRWSHDSFPADSIPAVMARLRSPLRNALADTSQRSFGANIAAFAQSRGVDFSDPGAVQDFFDDYNSMNQADRTSISDGLGLPGRNVSQEPGRPHLSLVPDIEDELWDGDEIENLMDQADVWPDFLGGPEDLDELAAASPPPMARAEDLDALDTVFFRRTDAVLAWVGEGRPVTKTGALRRADTRELLAHLNLQVPDFQSMWDVPELESVWSTLTTSGYLDLGPTRATPSRENLPAGGSATLEEQIVYRVALHFTLLNVLLSPMTEQSPLADPPLALMALVKAAKSGGLPMPYRDEDAGIDEFLAFVDLRLMHHIGLITIEDDVAHCPAPLLPFLAVLPASFDQLLAEEDEAMMEAMFGPESP